MLTIVLAGLLGILGAVAVLAYAHQADKRAIAGDKAVTVLAASGPIPGGTSLLSAKNQNLLTTETVPASSVSGVPVVSTVNSGNEHKVLSGFLGKGQLLLANMVVKAATRVTSNVAIPSNKVAVTIALCIPEAVAGWVTAGSRIAVFDTYVPHIVNQPPTLQRTCDVGHQAVQGGIAHTQQVAGLADLEVLSIGVASPGGPSASSALGAVQAASENSSVTSQGAVLVTVAVDPTLAWKLIQVAEVGMPYLALNAPNQNPGFGNGSTLFP